MKKVARTLMDGYVQFEDGSYGWYSPFKEDYVPVHEDEASAHECELYFDDDDDLFECVEENREVNRADFLVKCFYDLYDDDDSSVYLLNPEEIPYADSVLEQIWADNKLHGTYYDYYTAFMTDLTVDMGIATELNDYSTLDVLTRVWIDCRALEA